MSCCECCNLCCRSIADERSDASYAISVSIVEIYNEMVRDLLAEEGRPVPELQKGPTGFTIPDLTQSGEHIDVLACGHCVIAESVTETSRLHTGRSKAAVAWSTLTVTMLASDTKPKPKLLFNKSAQPCLTFQSVCMCRGDHARADLRDHGERL